MKEKLNINQWDEDERPREKFLKNGPSRSTPAELLAILIGSGSASETAVSLMQRVMEHCKGKLRRLGEMKLEDLTQFKGIGTAKAVTIMAACELARRRMDEKPEDKIVFNCSQAIDKHFRARMQDLPHEECYALLLRNDLSLKDEVLIGRGGLTETSVDIRVVMEAALRKGATAVALCHNHPSGSTKPSRHDRELTTSMSKACALLRLHLVDHVIVSYEGYYSFRDEGEI